MNQKQELKKFGKCLLLTLPALLLVSLPFLILLISGEIYSLDHLIRLQANANRCILFAPAYTNNDAHYKWKSILYRRPEVIALGSSRVLAIRSGFFKPGTFYNGARSIKKIEQFRYFLELLLAHGYKPKVLILALDQIYYNDAFAAMTDEDKTRPDKNPYHWRKMALSKLSQVPKDIWEYKIQLNAFFHPPKDCIRVGLSALMNHQGYQNDGSYYFGHILKDPAKSLDYQFKDTFLRIEKGDRRFYYGKKTNQAAIEETKKLLEFCKRNGIQVIGLLPPFVHAVYEKMKSMPNQYEYCLHLQEKLKPIFDSYQYSLFDFTDLKDAGAPDQESFDGFHASEKAYLRILLLMAEKDAGLREYIADETSLRQQLEKTDNTHMIYPHPQI